MTLTSPNRGYLLEHIDGSSGSMSWWNGLFTRVADCLGELRESAQYATELPGVGQAITAVRDDATELVAAIAPDIAEAELLAAVLQRYSDAYDAHAKRANDLIDEIEAAHAGWDALNAEADNAGRAALAAAWGDDQAEIDTTNRAATEAIAARDIAKAGLDELWAQYEGYYGDWDDAYDAALAELAVGAGVSLRSVARNVLDELMGANTPEAVLALWLEHPELHAELLKAHPDILGNLDGIPYADRVAANETVLMELYEADLDEPLRSDVDALYTEIVFNDGLLISFDPTGSEQTTAALWYGDFDAENISVLVPGMNSNVAGIGEWGVSAKDVNAVVPDSATVVWFGYDSPNELEEPGMGRAEHGAAAFTGFLNGLDASAPSAQLNVVAHSYGSTMSALAIGSQPDGLGVDRFITVGSAGLPDDQTVLDNLQSPSAPAIFATMADDDFWAPVGQLTAFGHGTSPGRLDGVTLFDSDGGIGSDGEALIATPGHAAHHGANSFPWDAGDAPGGYLLDGSESFYNVQQIIATGAPGTERGGEGSAPDWMDQYSGGYHPYWGG